MATRITAPLVTPPFNYNDTTAPMPVGSRVNLSDGGVAVFCQAVSEISQYAAVAIGVGWTATNLTTTAITAAAGVSFQIGWAQTSIASANYFWAQLSGRPKCMLAANCAPGVRLFTTATAGVLDDAVVSIGEVMGVAAKTTISNATAITLIVPVEGFAGLYALQA